jgi:hypothetical protein
MAESKHQSNMQRIRTTKRPVDPWIWAIRYTASHYASVQPADQALQDCVQHDGFIAGRVVAPEVYRPSTWGVVAFFSDPNPRHSGLEMGELSENESRALGLPAGCQRVLTKHSIIEDAIRWR